MSEEIIKEIYASIEIESKQNNFDWRILRVNTLIDLILVSLANYMKVRDRNTLIEICTLSIKCIHNLEKGNLDLNHSLKLEINSDEKKKILSKIKNILNELKKHTFNKTTHLADNRNYLKILRNYDYSEVLKENLFDLINNTIYEY